MQQIDNQHVKHQKVGKKVDAAKNSIDISVQKVDYSQGYTYVLC